MDLGIAFIVLTFLSLDILALLLGASPKWRKLSLAERIASKDATKDAAKDTAKALVDLPRQPLPVDGKTERQGGISQRASRNLSWFLKKHAGHMARMDAKQPQIDLMTAENWIMRDMLTAAYKDYIQAGLSNKSLSYADGLGGDPPLLQAAAKFFNRHFKPVTAVKPEHIVTGAGCSAILDNMLYDICDRGDGVLVEIPFWGESESSQSVRGISGYKFVGY